MLKKVTIYDVAREADVSLATVSRVINGSSVVKANTRDKVLAAIQRLDFKPNEIARGLATSKTTTIAIIFPQMLFAHVKDMIGGIGDVGRHLDYNVCIYTTDEIGDADPIDSVIEKVVKSRADGVILFNNEHIQHQIELVQKYKIPTVVIGKRFSDERIGSIFVDAKAIAYNIVDQYLAKGKKDIVFIDTKQNLINTQDMIQGMKEAFIKHQIHFDENKQVLPTSPQYEDSYVQLMGYFKSHKHDLVFAGYDKEAVAVVNAASDNNIKIPHDMEVIGMMNSTYASICRPTLTSVHMPIYDMGALAVRLLTKILHQEEIDTKEVTVQHLLMPRDTTM